jgi:hypothetical protein
MIIIKEKRINYRIYHLKVIGNLDKSKDQFEYMMGMKD